MKIHTKIFSLITLFILSFLSNQLFGQSYQEIISSGGYIFGEAEGRSAIEADRLALSRVSEQLNVFVTSEVNIRRDKVKVDKDINNKQDIKVETTIEEPVLKEETEKEESEIIKLIKRLLRR